MRLRVCMSLNAISPWDEGQIRKLWPDLDSLDPGGGCEAQNNNNNKS